LDNEVDDS